MLSRVADSLYWMSRYVVRAENVARLIDVNLNMLLDIPDTIEEQWRPLVMITGDRSLYPQHYDSFTRDNVIEFMTFDLNNPNSILSSLRSARENARSMREIISSEMWEQLNSFYLMVSSPDARSRVQIDPHDFYSEIKQASALFIGITDTTLTHGEGWHFARMGQMMEQADKTSRIVDVKYFILLPSPQDVGTPLDDTQWAALLRSISGFEMYRKRYGRTQPDLVTEFLLLDRQFPRSILFCLTQALMSLHDITGTPTGMYRNLAEQRMGQLYADLSYASAKDVITNGLHEYLDAFQAKLNAVGDAIFQSFFALRPIDQSVQYQ